MGVYNPYKDKPKNCYDCEVNNGECCFANEDNLIEISNEYALRQMHPDCPLIEIKTPHGDLVDVDVLNQRAKYWMVNFNLGITLYDVLQDFYKYAEIPTVIEAEEK